MDRPHIALPLAAALLVTRFLHVSPNLAILMLTAGLLLICVELNRPGAILPGAAGLLAVLIAADVLAGWHPRTPAVVALAAAAVSLLLGLRYRVPVAVAALATVMLSAALAFLTPGVAPGCAIACGVVLGVGTSWLTRIARRARANKGLD